jgi:hypothetical protein
LALRRPHQVQKEGLKAGEIAACEAIPIEFPSLNVGQVFDGGAHDLAGAKAARSDDNDGAVVEQGGADRRDAGGARRGRSVRLAERLLDRQRVYAVLPQTVPVYGVVVRILVFVTVTFLITDVPLGAPDS